MSNDVKDGGPAFPHWDGPSGECFNGMTLRDYFAAKALVALLSDHKSIIGMGDEAKMRGIEPDMCAARCAYEYADAMLRARES